LTEIQRQAQERGLALIRTPMGLAFAPTRGGEVISPEVQNCRHQSRSAFGGRRALGRVAKVAQPDATMGSRTPSKVKELNQEVGLFAVGHLIEELRQAYLDLPAVLAYLTSVQQDVIDNPMNSWGLPDTPPAAPAEPAAAAADQGVLFRRYQVNVVVDHSGIPGAPVIYEDHPPYKISSGASNTWPKWAPWFRFQSH
jgi:hypothetical protein